MLRDRRFDKCTLQRPLRLILFGILAVTLLAPAPLAHARPAAQADPAAQCAEGERLIDDQKMAEALPLLEAGYLGLKQAAINDPKRLATCMVALGIARFYTGNTEGALEAYLGAWDIIQHNGSDLTGEIRVLIGIGRVQKAREEYNEALRYYERALDVERRSGMDARLDEAKTLSDIGMIYISMEHYDKALVYFQQALIIAQLFIDRKGEGATLYNIGAVYWAQKRYDEALVYFQRALTVVQKINDHFGEGSILNAIGDAYAEQKLYDPALQSYRLAAASFQQVPDPAGEGEARFNIGWIYQLQGRYDAALAQYRETLAVLRQAHDAKRVATTLNNIGFVYGEQGRYSEALQQHAEALEIERNNDDRNGEETTLHNIGWLYQMQGRYEEALPQLLQAFKIAKDVGDRSGAGITLNSIGILYADQGKYDKALKFLEDAKNILHAEDNLAREGTVLNSIGTVYSDKKEYGKALEYLKKALVIRDKAGDRYGKAFTLYNIGTVYHEQEQLDTAMEYYQQALTIFEQDSTLDGLGITHTNIGIVYRFQKRYDEALIHLQLALENLHATGNRRAESDALSQIGIVYQLRGNTKGALDAYRQAMNVLETVRANVGNDQVRANFIDRYSSFYEHAALLYHQQGQDDEAFLTSERGRARAFLDSLATTHIELLDEEADTLLQHERATYDARQSAQDARIQARTANPPDSSLIADLEKQLAAAEQAHDQALTAIEQRGGQLAALVPGRMNGVLDRAAVQQLLDPQTTLVAYQVLDDQILAFVLTQNSFQTIALPVRRSDLFTQIQALRRFANTTEAIPASSRQLYTWLIAPLKLHLTTPHLAIVPHSILHYLPFAALSDGRHFLIDDYTLTVLPSASSLPFIQQNSGRTPAAPLILGNPTTNDPQLHPLAFATREVQAIGRLYGVTPLLGAQATARALRERVAQAGIVHLAAHGIYTTTNALASAVFLAPDDSDDGQLTVSMVYGLNLHAADLVVLSACETQLGLVSSGDEVVGLTRAFFFAGTPSVIATLWSVDDQPTELLMERFYSYLQAGRGKADALRQAQLDVRAKYPNPYYWAGFVLSGDAGLVEPSMPWTWIGIALLLFVLMAGMAFVLNRLHRRFVADG